MPPIVNPDINVFAQTDFRHQTRRFGIKMDDRRRHMYLLGKTGVGKSTMIERMFYNDMWAGHGVALIDPHGDTAEKMIDFVPPHRVPDVVYFNPADLEFPLGFNILESVRPDDRHLVASGLMGVFKKIWPDVWSARMEYILNYTILGLLEGTGTTLLCINRLLADRQYRRNIEAQIKDPVVKAFWITEFDRYDEKYQREATAAIQNKIGQFLSAGIIRNVVSQPHSTFSVREIMDQKKIFIANISKGRVGEDASRLLGGMLITKIQLAAMERVDTVEEDRPDFILYVDEFQNFATESFANILSEARKYRLSLVVAHQYVAQLEETVADAVFGNVGTIICFRIGAQDAKLLEREFMPTFIGDDLVNLPKYHAYLKLMIDGITSRPFSASTIPPVDERTGTAGEVIIYTRATYAGARAEVEERIRHWSEDPSSDYASADGVAPVILPESAPAFLAPRPERKNKNLPPPEKWFPATCDRCGSATTVPFPPDGSRRIYCKDCYKFRHEDEEQIKVALPAAPTPAPVTRKRHRKKKNFSGLIFDNPPPQTAE